MLYGFITMLIFILGNVPVHAILYPDMVHSEERIYYGENDSRNNPFLVEQTPKTIINKRLGSTENSCTYFYFRFDYAHGYNFGGEGGRKVEITLHFVFYSSRYKDGFSFGCLERSSTILQNGEKPSGQQQEPYYAQVLTDDEGPLLLPNEPFTISIAYTGIDQPWTCGIYYYWELY